MEVSTNGIHLSTDDLFPFQQCWSEWRS